MAEEIVIAKGRVLDGSGSQAVLADIRVSQGRIVEVGPHLSPGSARVIDASGLTVAPGFIDAHTHAEFILAAERSAHYLEPFVRQGITTMVTGHCGVSPAPFNTANKEHLEAYWDSLLPEEGLPWAWKTMGEFLGQLDRAGTVMNVAQLVGHGSVRLQVMGYRSGAPTKEELRGMRDLVRESLAQGALGLSYGLSYVPGIWADTEELIEVARDVPNLGGVIAVHLRSQGELDRLAGVLYQRPEYSFMTDSVGIGRRSRATTIYGTFPRFLGRHAREWKSFSLEEAVRKSTSLPASQYGLTDRGSIHPGHHADLVIFDPVTICDRASFAQPYQFSEGIESVLINGVPVWHQGCFDATSMAGQTLRRGLP